MGDLEKSQSAAELREAGNWGQANRLQTRCYASSCAPDFVIKCFARLVPCAHPWLCLPFALPGALGLALDRVRGGANGADGEEERPDHELAMFAAQKVRLHFPDSFVWEVSLLNGDTGEAVGRGIAGATGPGGAGDVVPSDGFETYFFFGCCCSFFVVLC